MKTEKKNGMRTWTVTIYRKKSYFEPSEFSRTETIEARTENAAWNKAERIWNNPYQHVMNIEPEQK